jgi:chromosome segregation ATPase
MAATKDDARKALERAEAATPGPVVKAMQELKDKLAQEITARETAVSEKTKAEGRAKEAKAEKVESLTKASLKGQDCATRERKATAEASTATEKMKVVQVKLDDTKVVVTRKDEEIKKLKSDIKQLQETGKLKDESQKATDEKLKRTNMDYGKCQNKFKLTMAKLSSGEGALMAEIDTLKTGADQDASTIGQLKQTIAKLRMDETKITREMNAQTVKLREAQQQVFGAKAEAEKYKVRFDTLETAHSTVTERYRNANSKLELCSDRTKDAKIKFQGCEEAMRRMKAYNTDQQNEQKLELARLRTELETAKNDAQKLQVSQEEKAQSAAMAKEATERAVADAVEQAQAKGLAVQTTAQEAVDKAAREAVRLANQQANSAAGTTA